MCAVPDAPAVKNNDSFCSVHRKHFESPPGRALLGIPCWDLPGEQPCRDIRDDRREWDHEYDHHEQALWRVRHAEVGREQCGDIACADAERHGTALRLLQTETDFVRQRRDHGDAGARRGTEISAITSRCRNASTTEVHLSLIDLSQGVYQIGEE